LEDLKKTLFLQEVIRTKLIFGIKVKSHKSKF